LEYIFLANPKSPILTDNENSEFSDGEFLLIRQFLAAISLNKIIDDHIVNKYTPLFNTYGRVAFFQDKNIRQLFLYISLKLF
jgi:hypothetical protein